MPEVDPVVSDTSPLLSLALIDRLDVLRDQFSTITAPEQVWGELAAGEKGLDALQSLRADGVLELVTVPETPLFAEFDRELDALRNAGFWISDDLYENVLERAGNSD